MNQFSDLLKKAAAEVREYCGTPPHGREDNVDFLLLLAHDMEVASAFESNADAERAIDRLAYGITDQGPMSAEFAPSFQQALGALQRRRKSEGRKRG